jgi:antitoxin (DNA-binding transcriptional repressor) of toxin-antitoxin stability system
MSTTISLEEAQANLRSLIHQLAPGEELVITENQQPVAKLVSELVKKMQPRKAGNCVGMMRIVADDDEHLEDFEEYM